MQSVFKIISGGLSLLILSVLILNVYIHVDTKSYIYESVSAAPVAQTALVLGAAVLEDGSLSPIFMDRANMAIDLYRAGKVSKILVSGDNSTVEYNEVNPVRLHLLNKGVQDKDIFLDHAGFDTYSSMYRARDIFSVSSVVVVTQSFHLPRSVFIARHLGIDAYGVNADVGHMLLRNYIREVIADEKAILDLIVRRQPKFLGDKIPITSSIKKDNPPDAVENDEILEIPAEQSSSSTSILPFDSGVQGVVLQGPVCPVMQNPPQPECADQSFVTTVQVSRNTSGKQTLFADTKTNANGEYSLQLPPGDYVLTAVSGTPFPYCQSQTISVRPKSMLEVTLVCDTGIR